MSAKQFVFSGENALLDYLNPDLGPPTPMVELPHLYRSMNVRIFAKLQHALPLGNIKSLPVYSMLYEAHKAGHIGKEVDVAIEGGTGNTALPVCLAVIGRAFGLQRMKALVLRTIVPSQIAMLRLFGIEIIKSDSFIEREQEAAKLAEKNGWFHANQFANSNNPAAQRRWTGKEIWEQMPSITVFAAGMGSTGTIVGAGQYLKEVCPRVVTVGVVRTPDNPASGPAMRTMLDSISHPWNKTDHLEEVGAVDSFRTSLGLLRIGVMGGPSSGMTLKGLYQFLDRAIASGDIDRLRNEQGEVVCVFSTCDQPFAYVNDYFSVLPMSDFPDIDTVDTDNVGI